MSKTNPHVIFPHVRVHEQVRGLFLQPGKVRELSRRDAQVLEQVSSRRDVPESERERIPFRRDVPVRAPSSHDDGESCALCKAHESQRVH